MLSIPNLVSKSDAVALQVAKVSDISSRNQTDSHIDSESCKGQTLKTPKLADFRPQFGGRI
jgi:hypothetical protein